MRTEHESFHILERALAAAKADEADAVFIATDRNISRFANSNLHQNMSETTAELTLRVILNGASGLASTTSFDDAEIARTAGLAREAARHSHAIPGFSGLYRGGEDAPPLPTFDEATAHLAAAEKARALRKVFDDGAARGVEFAGSFTHGATSIACANSHGVRRYAPMTSGDAAFIALTERGSGFATDCGRSASAIDLNLLGTEAIDKATLRAESREEIEPGEYDVILEPPAIAEVLDWLNMIAFCGQSYEDGSSFFVDNLGQQILSEQFTLADDSIDPAFFPFPFDLEGLPRRRTMLIERGILRTPVLDKEWADRLGMQPTANAWHLSAPEHGSAFHLSIEAGSVTREEMIRSTKRGIWVTRFNYVNGLLEPRSALMTGTTRDGTFMIRDGEVAARLPNLRWTQSIVEALSNIESVGSERRRVSTWYNPFGGTVAPAMKIRGWHFTGKQESR